MERESRAARAKSISPPSTIPKKSGGLIRLWRSGSVRCSSSISGSRVKTPGRLSPFKVIQGATLASRRPSLSLAGAIGTAIRSAGFETTSPLERVVSGQHEPKGHLPAIGMRQHESRHRRAAGARSRRATLAKSLDEIVVRLTTPRRPGLRPWPR